MNPVERIIQDDVHRLVDRLASTTRAGAIERYSESAPDLRRRLDAAEAALSEARSVLVESYAAWLTALEDCANVWALAELQTEESIVPERWAA